MSEKDAREELVDAGELRSSGWTPIENSLLTTERVGDGAKLTFLVLASHAFRRDGVVFPSVRRLSTLRCKSERSIRSHLRELQEAGLIRRKRRNGGGAVTTLLDPGEVLWELGAEENCHEPEPLRKKTAGPDRKKTAGPSFKKKKLKKNIREGPGKTAETSEHRAFVDWLVGEVLPDRGVTYEFAGAKDGAHVRALLKAHGPDRLRRIVLLALEDDWIQDVGFSLTVLRSKANQLSSRLGAAAKRPPRRWFRERCPDCTGGGCASCDEARENWRPS